MITAHRQPVAYTVIGREIFPKKGLIVPAGSLTHEGGGVWATLHVDHVCVQTWTHDCTGQKRAGPWELVPMEAA